MEKIEIYELENEYDEILTKRDFGMQNILYHIGVLQHDLSKVEERTIIERYCGRLKTFRSTLEKCVKKKGATPSREAFEKIHDIAGIRIVVPFLDDVYRVEEALTRRENLRVIETRDYIKVPKPSGYRSLHIIAETKVALANRDEWVLVEIQIRTILQDAWSTLEHKLRYKERDPAPEAVTILVSLSQYFAKIEEELVVSRDYSKMKALTGGLKTGNISS